MTLSPEQRELAARIDARVRQLADDGCDDLGILAEMFDLMPDFKRLMDTAGQDGMDELCERFGGFFRYAKILETVAEGIAAGEIEVPE